MNIFDIIILIILLISFITGFSKGFFVELGSVVGIILGLYLAMNFTQKVVEWIDIESKYSYEIGFAITLVAVVVAVWLLARFITNFVDIINLGIFNKLFGGVFGVFKSILIMSMILLIYDSVTDKMSLSDKTFAQESYSYGILKSISEVIFPYVSQCLQVSQDFFEGLIK